MRVLVADDDQVTLKLLSSSLKKWGYEVEVASDGTSVWNILHSNNPPQLALLDWMMPGIEGPEICRRLRSEYSKNYTYIIILTGRSQRADLIEALHSGADDYIAKPINNDELRLRIRAGERIIQAYEDLQTLNLQLDEKVLNRTLQLEQALKDARHVADIKSTFLANMSHEIRTPLNSIVSYVELLLYSELNQGQRDDLEIVKNSVYSLKNIIDNILDFSKLEADRMVVDNSTFEIQSLINEIFRIFKPKLEEKQLFMILIMDDPSLPSHVIGDRVRLQQVLTNLIGNAIKFSKENSKILLKIMTERLNENLASIHFSVTDTGIGIAPDKLSIIFDSFVQAETSTSSTFGGTGLGLAISKGLVELMNGRIWVESVLGQGSSFHFTIPFERPDLKNVSNLSEININNDITALPNNSGNGLRILLAEDNLTNQSAMTRIMEKNGFIVETSESGKGVLKKLSEASFDLILMDINMPLMGGVETTLAIRQSNRNYANIPILALTANTIKGDEEHYLQHGMNGCVGKPVNYQELFSVIEKLIK